MIPGERKQFLHELVQAVGESAVIHDPDEIQRFLKDNSWLSPILTQHLEQMRENSGQSLRVTAVVSPAQLVQLGRVLAAGVRFRVPMVVRGGGTSNFGQTVPLEGGLIIDIRRLKHILDIQEDRITAQAGAIQEDVDRAARERGKELSLLTTTYASATVAGWVAGGHVGLGTSMYGTIWDGNVLCVKILTAEEMPRELTLTGDDLLPVLHTYGTTGVITEVTFPIRPARDWLETIVVFDRFEQAAEFVTALANDTTIYQRVAAAQESPIPATFTPLKHLFDDHQSIVLAIIDSSQESICRELASGYGGSLHVWKKTQDPRRIPMAYMVYGHRMLWIKKLAPQAAFLHCYMSPDTVLDQLRALKERYGSAIWIELKYMRSRWLRALRGLPPEGILPAPVITLVRGEKDFLEEVMAFCDSIGVTYQNPHTFLLEETGLFRDFEKIVEFKHKTDPYGLLNPGKIGARLLAGA